MLLHVDPYVHVGVDVGEGAAARSSAVTSTHTPPRSRGGTFGFHAPGLMLGFRALTRLTCCPHASLRWGRSCRLASWHARAVLEAFRVPTRCLFFDGTVDGAPSGERTSEPLEITSRGGWQTVEFTVAAASVALVEITPAKAK